MKRCSHCGRTYPDDATICAIDEAPLEDAGPQKKRTVRGVYLAIPKQRKIPLSLLIVSYLFLIPALPSILSACFMGWLIYECGLHGRGSTSLLIISGITCASILFWYFLSRGLRYCSCGWRICALIIIWLSLIDGIVQIAQFLITQKLPHHETPFEFWVGIGLVFFLLMWQYWVLTRPDIRSLFYPDTKGIRV
jgi:hypothetical protein